MELPASLQSTSHAGLRGWEPAAAVERLAALLAALPGCGDPQVLAGLAAGLPAAVHGLAPEVCLALAAVAEALVPHRPTLPRDVATLEPRLRVAWRRVQLALGDAATLAALDDAELLQTVHGWSIDPVLEPLPLLRRLADARDPRLRMPALEWPVPRQSCGRGSKIPAARRACACWRWAWCGRSAAIAPRSCATSPRGS